MPDIYKRYKEEVKKTLRDKREYSNDFEIPALSKIVVSTGIGSDKERDTFNEAREQISLVTGQMPVTTKSRKNVANFKLRRGMQVGAMVTLRGARMYEFYDRLVHNALPRIRDFRGVPRKSFDGAGNYNLGIQDISVFTEIDLDKVKQPIGVNITIVTSAGSDEEAMELLQELDMPFS